MARTRLHFSLSHSRDLLVCAVSSQVVGVDIEDTAVDRDFERLGAWIYGAHETAMLANQCQSARRAGFYALWALKEAWLKCWGTHYPMCLVQFAPCAARDAQAVVLADPRWTLALVGRAQVSTMACSPELNDAALAWWRIVDVPFGA